ncbi:MAG: AI-2E family transporter [Ruminococcaceae bacterium]|nr:AI-2E family transporter [Oscillospiraceae bacterium]
MQKINSSWWKALLFGLALIIGYKLLDNVPKIVGYVRAVVDILTPFFIGGALAFFLHKPVNKVNGWIQKTPAAFVRKRSMTLALTAVYAVFLVAIYFFIRFFVEAIYENIAEIIANWEAISARSMEIFNHVDIPQKQEWLDKINEFLTHLLETEVLLKAGHIVGGVASSLVSVFTGVIISIYMISEKESLKALLKRGLQVIFRPLRAAKVQLYTRRLSDMFYSYFTGLAMDAIVVGAISTVFYIIFDAPYPWLLGLIVAVGNMIPFFGPIVAALVIGLVCLVALGPTQALWVLVFQLVLGQLDGNLLQPKILGNSVGISPFWVIFSVVFFGGIWGPFGMLLGVPLVAAIRMMVLTPIGFTE